MEYNNCGKIFAICGHHHKIHAGILSYFVTLGPVFCPPGFFPQGFYAPEFCPTSMPDRLISYKSTHSG